LELDRNLTWKRVSAIFPANTNDSTEPGTLIIEEQEIVSMELTGECDCGIGMYAQSTAHSYMYFCGISIVS